MTHKAVNTAGLGVVALGRQAGQGPALRRRPIPQRAQGQACVEHVDVSGQVIQRGEAAIALFAAISRLQKRLHRS